MPNIIEESFGINLRVMSLLGLFCSDSRSVTSTKIRGSLLYVIFVLFLTPSALMDLILAKSSDIMQMTYMVIFLAETSAFIFKLLPFLLNGQRISDCVNYFGHSQFSPKDEEETKIRDECIYICKRNSTVYFYGILTVIILWILPSLFSRGRSFPLDVWLPYDPKASAGANYATLFYLVAGTFYNGLAGTMCEPVIAGLAYHATSQLKILKYNLQHLGNHVTHREEDDELYIIQLRDVHRSLYRSIKHHKSILEFFSEYETCFSWSIFCQFAASTLALCFCCIGMILAPSNLDALKSLANFFAVSFQIFFYCHYGTLLFQENDELLTAIYMGPWYQYDVTVRKILLFVMERSKRPIILTAGKVIPVTLQTFASVLKTSYSLIAVLNNHQ